MSLPPDLTDDDFHAIFESLDVYLNTTILQALTHGLYTGILIVTFWSIFRSTKNSTVGRCIMVLAISSLYVLASVALGEVWAFTHHAFIDEGQNCYTVYSELNGFSPMSTQATLAAGITSCISTVIADSSLIWRCWILWGRRWLVVVIPILCTILGTVFKAIESYHTCFESTADNNDDSFDYSGGVIDWMMSYLAFTLTTTLWCTIFLLYRIMSVAGSSHGPGIRSYRGVLEALVESATLYAIALIIDMVFVACNLVNGYYVDVLTAAIKGIAPTLLVGRVAAGHARPDDSTQESTRTVSSLNFGARSLSTMQEAQVTRSAELDEIDNMVERNIASMEGDQDAGPLDLV